MHCVSAPHLSNAFPLLPDTVVEAQAENLGREECKVLVVKRGGEAELVEEVAQLVNIVIGVQPPELGPHCQHLLLGPGPSGGSRNILATIIKVFVQKKFLLSRIKYFFNNVLLVNDAKQRPMMRIMLK